MSSLYIGLMSGTSLDGVDGVLVDLPTEAVASMQVLGHVHRPFATSQRDELLELNHSGQNELHRAALAGNALARLYAQLVADLLSGAGVDRRAVRAIGAHGQTLRHRPGQFDATGYTIQLNAPALLAEVSGIDVVCDFRSRDIAAGGQGAPLVPAFHCATFGRHAQELAVLNLGGISNLTLMRANAVTHGFDCGPGNALMDLWCQRHTGARFDDQGAWAASGKVHALLLETMLREPFFSMQPPKSSGRDLFNSRGSIRESTNLLFTTGTDSGSGHLGGIDSAGLRARCAELPAPRESAGGLRGRRVESTSHGPPGNASAGRGRQNKP